MRTLFEPACAACTAILDQPLSGPVCERCWNGITSVAPPWCARCGDELPPWKTGDDHCARCVGRLPCYSVARSAGRYDGPLREIIHSFKFGSRRLLAEPLGRMMRLAGADVLDGADAVIPVPLHPWRSLRRGFNQSDDLARELGVPVWRALRRRRYGPPQASLPATARHNNLERAFSIDPIWSVRARVLGHSLVDRTLVVIDDVMTTGDTVEACSQVLLESGAREVRALTAARTVKAKAKS